MLQVVNLNTSHLLLCFSSPHTLWLLLQRKESCGHKGGPTGDFGAVLLSGSCMKQVRFGCVCFVVHEPHAGLGAVDIHVFSSH